MDFLSYPSMDILPFQQQNQQLFDCLDETFEMEQLLAAVFDSSSSSSSSELFQCSSNDGDICFDPLYSLSEFLLDDNEDVFLPADDFFVDDKNYALVADDHKNDIIFVADEDKNDHVFLANDDHYALFPQNHFMSPIDHCYQLDNTLNHPENTFSKRQKLTQNGVYKRPYYYNHDSTFFQGMLAPPPPQLSQTQPPPPPPPPFDYSIPPVFNIGTNNKKEEESRSLSSQSLSARQRRRKISEKTKELGKLIPGAQKMNTAEMFEAASSYIKFLQAQFAVLQLMESSPSSSATPTDDEEGLKCLVGSPLVQEKLCSNKKCLIPKGLVKSLENHKEIQSNSQISKDVRNLILTFC